MKFSTCLTAFTCLSLLFVNSGCLVDNQEIFDTFFSHESSTQPVLSHAEFVPNQYIVLLKQNGEIESSTISGRSTSVDDAREVNDPHAKDGYYKQLLIAEKTCQNILKRNRISSSALKKTFTGVQLGMVVRLNQAEKSQLLNDPAIEIIEQDQFIALGEFNPQIKTPFNPSNNNGNGNNGQSIPYGVTRVGGVYDFEVNSQYSYRWVWIMDTGIDNHSELRMVSSLKANFSDDNNYKDEFGHGTHVAGIIGAKNNNKGVVGVAAGAYMVNTKVLNQNGQGYASDIVAALNYISIYVWPEDVINMSIGGNASNIVDNAVLALANSGVKVVVSAGNAGQHVSGYSPARISHPNVFVIGSIDNADTFSYYSNYGTGLDFAAPGDNIMSTFNDNQFAIMSGTSMAAPHVSGVLLAAPTSYTANGSSSPAPDGNTIPVISY